MCVREYVQDTIIISLLMFPIVIVFVVNSVIIVIVVAVLFATVAVRSEYQL